MAIKVPILLDKDIPLKDGKEIIITTSLNLILKDGRRGFLSKTLYKSSFKGPWAFTITSAQKNTFRNAINSKIISSVNGLCEIIPLDSTAKHDLINLCEEYASWKYTPY